MASSPSPQNILPVVPTVLKPSETTLERLRKTHTNELIFALCGPIGSPLREVAGELETLLTKEFGYECETIRLSDFITEYSEKREAPKTEFDRINDLVTDGNTLRERYGKGVLVNLGISRIFKKREDAKTAAGATRNLPQRFCHIFDSIKNQEELDVLRAVYGKLLFCIGVFSPLQLREEKLCRKMEKWQVYKLIDQDSGEEKEHGQTVRDTFPQSDFFLRVDSNVAGQTSEKAARLMSLIMKVDVLTPTVHENAMYIAASAANNSACLSRQVGASITDSAGRILGVGWNDVPKFGGGLYNAESAIAKADHRCMNIDLGICHNDQEKGKIARTTVNDLVVAGFIDASNFDKAVATILKSKVKHLIEFSRAVHAEVHAIIHASQESGSHMRGGKLYCTTYPCHSCARHIIASGIVEVFFIEPYRKSLATQLHGDAITENLNESGKVKLIPYEGVAPRRFNELFAPNVRKKDGKKIAAPHESAATGSSVSLESFPVLEALIVDDLGKKGLLGATPETANESTASRPAS